MADAIALRSVEEQHLVCIPQRFVVAEMPNIDTAIGKNQLDILDALLGALVPAAASTFDVPHRGGFGVEECLEGEVPRNLVTHADARRLSSAASGYQLQGKSRSYRSARIAFVMMYAPGMGAAA